MKHNYLPIPTGWKMFYRELLRRVRAQVDSPWTKITVLGLFLVVATRDNISFSFSIDFGNQTNSVFGKGGAQPEYLSTAALTSFTAPKREWTEKQLRQLDYVAEYKSVALEEMRAHGIPASITLAQGLLESGTGRSSLATKNNNHFGIKCFSKKCSKHHCSNHSDDHHKDFFRRYDSPENSYRDHSKILLKGRYRRLFDLKLTDYRGWARGLSKAGYATDPRYAAKLISMIEDLELHRYDRITQAK